MEIYKDSPNRRVYFELPVLPTVNDIDVSLTQGGVSLYTFPEAQYEDGKYSVLIPFQYVSYDGDYEINWQISYTDDDGSSQILNRTTYFSVVTPYVSISDIKAMLGDESTDEEAGAVEAAVRHVINNYCSQSFGYSHKTLTVQGHGETALRLPERLVAIEGLSTLTANLNVLGTLIVSDGWYLKKGWAEETSAITSTSTYFGEDSYNNALPGEPGYEKPGHGPIIYAPNNGGTPTPWAVDYPFTITGWWGYTSVPAEIRSAALLLVNDYACSESAYRDRFLTSFKASDFRFDISPASWNGTGNVRADQLLDKYVLLNWMVV